MEEGNGRGEWKRERASGIIERTISQQEIWSAPSSSVCGRRPVTAGSAAGPFFPQPPLAMLTRLKTLRKFRDGRCADFRETDSSRLFESQERPGGRRGGRGECLYRIDEIECFTPRIRSADPGSRPFSRFPNAVHRTLFVNFFSSFFSIVSFVR